MLENEERLLIIGDLDDNTPVHAAGDLIEIQLFQREYTEIHDFLLEACMMCMDASGFIEYTDYCLEDTAEDLAGPDSLWMIRIQGTVIDGPALLNALKDVQCLRDDDCYGDYLEEMAQTMEEKPWLHEDCPLPALFRATRIEQLLYWFQWEGTADDQKPDIAKELVDLDPDFKHHDLLTKIL